MEENIFYELLKLNPTPGQKYTDWKIGSNQAIQIKIYKWMTVDGSEKYVTISYFTREVKKICKVKFTSQEYYDIVVLGLVDISQRPKCMNCGKYTKFIGLGKIGYRKVCSHDCDIKLKTERIRREGIALRGIAKSESHKNKIKAIKNTKEYKQRASKSIKEFYKTDKGILQRKKISKAIQRRNIDDIISGKFNNRKSKFLSGNYESKVWGKSFRYDSSWELNFLKYFDRSSMKNYIEIFDRCKASIRYNRADGTSHKYIPDFYIKLKSGIQIVVEIKPEDVLKNDPVVLAKRIAAKKYFHEKNIKYVVLTEKELYETRHQKYRNRVSNKLGLKKSFRIFDFIV